MVKPDSSLAPLQASSHQLELEFSVPWSLPLELSAPHQLGPTAEGHFSLKPAPRAEPKGTFGSGDEAQPHLYIAAPQSPWQGRGPC